MRIEGGPSSAAAELAVREVQARRTPASMADVRAALSRALEAATGRRPSARTIDVLAAQVSLETAHGDAMFNFNFGGIKGASPQGQTANYLTHEVLGGHDVTLKQGFRAYGSLDEGARDYISVLRARFPQAYTHAVAGDVDGFAHALKQAHYYTAPEGQYAAGLRAAAGVAPAAAPSPAPVAPLSPVDAVAPPATSAELSRVLDAIASTAARIAEPDPKE
ncbi:MAG TPA: glucosaminidase domain-containing protein [Polyangiaceae bacterium]|nr:glucosaminidase domain-containing protein [Polyangiaceae bacterium]